MSQSAHPKAIGANAALPLIPQPAHVEYREGTFPLSAQTRVVTAVDDAPACAAADHLADMLEEQIGVRLARTEANEVADIVFSTAPESGLPHEAYTLEISPTGIRVCAADAAGLFYGAVTLWQLMTGSDTLPASLPALRIEDRPRFAWRGFMLDSARHIQSTEQIKRLIDQAARHKLNTFHWHLTEDQGWRLEIKRYPKLTEVGAWRTPAGKAGIGLDGQPLRYGGFFTQAQAREIVAYASARHITVIPEIEMPGHAQAAIASYPELGCSHEAPPVSADWGIHKWLFNVEDSTFAFLENVLREVMEIFPSRYIHIGGDEAAKQQWRNSPQVQKRIAELGLENENALQSWFIRRIGNFLTQNGRCLLGWDEILEGGPLPESAAVMVWREMKSAAHAVRSGHDIVATPDIPYYLNYVQSTASDEPSSHGNLTTLQSVYQFEPVPADFSDAEAGRILGIQGNVWTEHIRLAAGLEHMVFPRLTAIAETAWTPQNARDWRAFLHRLAPQMRRFTRSGIRAADSAFAVVIDAQPDGLAHAKVMLSNQANFGELRYTLNGSEPTADSPRYTQPLSISLPSTLRANAFLGTQPLAKPRSQLIDELALRTRHAEQLINADKGHYAYSRLEADEATEGERLTLAIPYNAPLWYWPQAPLDGICAVRAEVLKRPFNFQHAYDENYRSNEEVSDATANEPVYLQLYLGSVNGDSGTPDSTPFAQARVDSQANAESRPSVLTTVTIPLPPTSGTHDLLLKFSIAPQHQLWAIHCLQLLTTADL